MYIHIYMCVVCTSIKTYVSHTHTHTHTIYLYTHSHTCTDDSLSAMQVPRAAVGGHSGGGQRWPRSPGSPGQRNRSLGLSSFGLACKRGGDPPLCPARGGGRGQRRPRHVDVRAFGAETTKRGSGGARCCRACTACIHARAHYAPRSGGCLGNAQAAAGCVEYRGSGADAVDEHRG